MHFNVRFWLLTCSAMQNLFCMTSGLTCPYGSKCVTGELCWLPPLDLYSLPRCPGITSAGTRTVVQLS